MRLLQYLNCKNRGSCSRTFRIVGEENVDDGMSWTEVAGSTHSEGNLHGHDSMPWTPST